MQVLVAGGTGMLGAFVVRHLIGCGHQVRVLTRHSGRARQLFRDVDIAVGDVTHPATLASATEGCSALHVSLRGQNDFQSYEAVEHRGLVSLLAVARAAGVQFVTYLSGAGSIDGHEHLLPVRIKLEAEAAVRSSGIPHTIFRATHFMESLDLFVRGRDATIIGRQPHRYHYLSAVDFAHCIERALTVKAARNKTLYAFGPEPYTMHEALALYMQHLQPRGRIRALPISAAKFLGTLSGNKDLRFAAELFAGFSAIGEAGDPSECNELLGKPTTTLLTWLRRRAPGPTN